VIALLVHILGRQNAYGINSGIAMGQFLMDTVHVLFHSTYRPWFLESARSYHLYHHFVQDGKAHGLTTSFWDMVFGTFPDTWYYYKKYPYLKYLQLPFPLMTFILIGLLSGDTTKTPVPISTTTTDSSAVRRHSNHGSPRLRSIVTSLSTSILIVCSWDLITAAMA
jgi:hypothetical protein